MGIWGGICNSVQCFSFEFCTFCGIWCTENICWSINMRLVFQLKLLIWCLLCWNTVCVVKFFPLSIYVSHPHSETTQNVLPFVIKHNSSLLPKQFQDVEMTHIIFAINSDAHTNTWSSGASTHCWSQEHQVDKEHLASRDYILWYKHVKFHTYTVGVMYTPINGA